MSTIRSARDRSTKTYTVEADHGRFTIERGTIEGAIAEIEALPASMAYRLFTSNAEGDYDEGTWRWSSGLSALDLDILAEQGIEVER